MEKKKRQLLEHTFQTYMEVGFGRRNCDLLVDITSKDFVGFGTAVDEKLFGISDVQELIQRQREQAKGLEMSFETDTLDIYFSQDENTAIYTNDVFIHVVTDSETIDMYVRISVVLEYIEDKWKAVHFHSSKPEQVQSEKDTWGLETWKERAEILEKEVAERTADLRLKNHQLALENALERVRTIAMSMQKPEDLADVGETIFNELKLLGFESLRNTEIIINNKERESIHCYYYSDYGVSGNIEVFYKDNPIIQNWADELQKANNAFAKVEINQSEMKDWIKYREEIGYQPDPKLNDASAVYYYSYSTGLGALSISSFTPIPRQQIKILERFRNVFGLSYQRYADIKKAEEQTREARIEAALERTRTKSMLMKNSNELNEISKVFHEQLLDLGIDSEFSFVWLPDEEKVEHLFWATWQNKKNGKPEIQSKSIAYPMDLSEPTTLACMADWKSGVSIHEHFVPPPEIKKFFASWEELLRGAEKLRSQNFPDGIYYTEAFMKYGCFGIDIRRPLSAQEKMVLNRFAIEFERAYTRFLDLQKAEAQTRKAQIETSLERVRARAMAMHDSNELDEVLSILCEQFDVLGIVPMSTHMTVFDFENNTFTFRETGKFGNRSFGEQTVALDAMDNWKETVDKWKADEATAINKLHFPKEQLPRVWEVFYESFASMPKDSHITPKDYPDGIYHTAGKHPFGYIGMNQIRPATEEEEQIVIKFANEFGMAYQRFLDLQKAEAQAREAQIEAALERVRAASMAMHNSDELSSVAFVLYEQLQNLGENLWGTGFGFCQENSKEDEFWFANENGILPPVLIPHTKDPVHKKMFAGWEQGSDFLSIAKGGKSLKEHYRYMLGLPKVKPFFQSILDAGFVFPEWQEWNAAYFSHGYLLVITIEPYKDRDILKRFAGVFEQAYTRFLDLQKAEAQARESQIEAALERVRSRTLAMQNSDELAETAVVVFKQLIDLGIEPNRLYFGIITDNSGDIEFWATDEDGSKISSKFTGNKNRNTSLQKMYEAWSAKEKSLTIDMQGKELEEYFDYLGNELHVPFKEGLLHKRRVQTMSFFSKGFIGMASPDEQPKESLEILERFAHAFNLTFTRFNDLKVAEANALQAEQDLIAIKEAKQKAEMALAELKSAQAQLIQAEKMASLGELTAGIAHEIQNPLNFVNNFSEVSNELIDEMNEELEKGDIAEAKEISKDIKQNLEKINHHGKRADAIVKGMLQHSRSSEGKKEPTDINALCDEYLRLAYHGLRAKDKSFNADFRTDFDSELRKIEVIPQDLGRVLLNLINNAFYAVNEKAKTGIEGYKPEVLVSTRTTGNEVEISVKDNGNGIAQNVVNKIFQPFFTTKPTGEGTGLGLSLSYDIIKAHGGKLEVETEEGKGTAFKILLPMD